MTEARFSGLSEQLVFHLASSNLPQNNSSNCNPSVTCGLSLSTTYRVGEKAETRHTQGEEAWSGLSWFRRAGLLVPPCPCPGPRFREVPSSHTWRVLRLSTVLCIFAFSSFCLLSSLFLGTTRNFSHTALSSVGFEKFMKTLIRI